MQSTSEVGLVFGEQLGIHCKISVMRYVCQTICRRRTAELAVESVVSAVFIHQTYVSGHRKAFDRGDDESEFAGNHIRVVPFAIDFVVPDRIAHDIRSDEICLVGIIDLHSVFIHDVALCVSYIKRIDRTHVVGDVEHIDRRAECVSV